MRQLSALDTQFLAIEGETHYGHVGGVAVVDPSTAPGGVFGVAEVRAMLEQRLHLLPPLRWKLVTVPFGLDRPYWIDDPAFDLDFHLREIALPAPGDDDQLAEQVARIFGRTLDRAHPLWEFYAISGLSGGRVALLTKMHHAMIDGMSGAEIMGVLFDLEPTGRTFDPPATNGGPDPEPSGLKMLGRGIAALPLQPVNALRAIPTTLTHLDVAPSVLGIPGAETVSRAASRVRRLISSSDDSPELVERPRMRAPRVPFSGRITPHRRFAFGSLSLPDVKRVKNHFGVTVNDVVVALTTAATREWLLDHDALPETPVLSMIPVSVRTSEEAGTYGNKISIMIVPLSTDEADPVARIEQTHEALKAAKDRHKALPASALQDVTTFIPPAINARAARAVLQLSTRPGMRPLYNMVISNVPGPPIPLYLGGAQLLANYPVSVVTDGSGLNVTVMSYRDNLDFGIVADRDQMPDLDTLMDGLRAALDELLALVDAA